MLANMLVLTPQMAAAILGYTNTIEVGPYSRHKEGQMKRYTYLVLHYTQQGITINCTDAKFLVRLTNQVKGSFKYCSVKEYSEHVHFISKLRDNDAEVAWVIMDGLVYNGWEPLSPTPINTSEGVLIWHRAVMAILHSFKKEVAE